MKTVLLALASTFLIGGVASAEKGGDTPAVSTPESVLLEGLKLIRDNKWDEWMGKHCSKAKLCLNENSKKSLKTYNLPAIQRRSKNCVKADGTIKVTRTDEISDTEKKIFVQCEETAMPVPFRLGLENGKWNFLSL